MSKVYKAGLVYQLFQLVLQKKKKLEITNEYDDRLCVREYFKIKVSKLR